MNRETPIHSSREGEAAAPDAHAVSLLSALTRALDGSLEPQQAPESLRADLTRLLRYAPRLGTFLDERSQAITIGDALAEAMAALGPLPPPLACGALIGPYRLVERIGVGGMGEVFRAERDDGTFRQTVALKMLRPTGLAARFPSQADAERFRRERQVLADLAHPNIARLLDGGSDSFGRPYLVMELVEGVPITEAVRARGMSIHRLVEFICQTCDAVEAAHRRMIVHCDIKPSNILVTSSGEVRLLDFGIAQILAEDDSGGGNASFTREDLRCSVAYASPEQLRGERPTAAVDIHALGLVLKEAIAAIDEVNPLPVGDREDLDAIARVATAPQAADRYLSVETLRLDLLRWMRREPVRARVTPWLRRTTLFCRRRASGVIAAGFVTLACAITLWAIIASLIATAGARDAERLAANRAAEEALVSESVSLFLQDLLGSVEPAVALGRDTTLVREMLDRAAARLDEDVALPERARATIDLTLGEAYRDLASYERAEMHLTRALATLRSNEADDEAIAQAAQRLAMLSVDTDRFDQARALFEEVVRLRNSHDPAHPLLGEAWRGLAQVERDVGRYDEAERAGLEALRLERLHGDTSGLIAALLERGSLLAWVQRLDEARVVVEEACAVALRELGERHPTTARARYSLAFILRRSGRSSEAITAYQQVLAIQRDLLHDRHPDIASTLNNLAGALEEAGRLAEAEPMYREAILRMRASLGDRHMDVATAENNLAGLLRTTGRYDEAREIFSRVLSVYRERLGDDHIWNAIVAENLARVEELAERWSEALVMADEALRVIESRNDGSLRPRWLQVASLRARCLLEGDPDAAVSLARLVWSEIQSTLPAGHRVKTVAKPRIVEILRRAGHEAEAEGVSME